MLVNKCENGAAAAAMGEAAASATGKISGQLAVKYASLQSNLSILLWRLNHEIYPENRLSHYHHKTLLPRVRQMTFTKMASAVMAGIVLLISATGRAAADEGMPATPAGLHGSIGMGVAVMPEYEGSKDHKTRAMPNINLFYGDSLFFTRMTAGANLLRFKTEGGVAITAGPLLAMRRGRDQDENAALNGLGDIDTGLDAGGFVRFRKQGWQASIDVRQNVTNSDQGATMKFSAGHGIPLGQKLKLRANLETTWASADYMNTFFGIDALQAAQSGIAQYEAGSGFKDAGVSVMADYAITRDWSGFATLRYKQLLGDATDSPIVADLGSRDQASASIGIKYRF